MKKKHTYWRYSWHNRPNLYEHDTEPITQSELVSVTGGVRTVIKSPDDPEWSERSNLNIITSRQYHRAKYRVIQKQKGKR